MPCINLLKIDQNRAKLMLSQADLVRDISGAKADASHGPNERREMKDIARDRLEIQHIASALVAAHRTNRLP